MPTPVSALLHAATLVTAGIYLLIRISPILEFSGSVLLIITLIGSSTAFFAATCGLLQNDLKRIIAFSTISQLGYILLLIFLLFLIYNILYLEYIHISIFSKITQNSIIPWIFNIKLIEHKHTYFSGFRNYKTGKAGYKNKSENLKINLKLAQSSLDEKSTKDKFLSYNKYLDKYNDFSFNNRKIIKEKY